MNLRDFCYKYFWWVGKAVLTTYPNIYTDVPLADMKIHPEVYASVVGFFFILTAIICAFTMVAVATSPVIIPNLKSMIAVALVFPPVLVLILGSNLPRLIAHSRSGGIETELPYTTAYLNIMSVGGLSPFVAFERLSNAVQIFPRIARYALRFTVLVRALGRDPISAFDDLAKRSLSPVLQDLLIGYKVTVAAGGDIIDYLAKKATAYFQNLIVKTRVSGERLASILESYLAVALLVLLTVNSIYLVNISVQYVSLPALSPASLFLLSYIFLPFISFSIIYLADVIQYKEPGLEFRPYIAYFGITLPLVFFLLVFMVMPIEFRRLRVIPLAKALSDGIISIGKFFNVDIAYYTSIGLALALIIATIPSAIYEIFISRYYAGLFSGLTRFLRDLVEVRKTGVSPEKAILILSNRPYKHFTNYLREIALEISLGIPLTRILSRLVKEIKAWRVKAFMYILTDAIEIGGGDPEVLERMARFAEAAEMVEVEKRTSMRTLLIIPYIGAITLGATIVLMVSFMGTLGAGAAAFRDAIRMLAPATVFNIYILGLVAGKVSSGTTYTGFKHAIFLTIMALAVVLSSGFLAKMLASIATAPPGGATIP